jgi:tetratricopeptide (TPR) repeat protein
MNRYGRMPLALVVAAMLLPASVEAQQDTRETRDAQQHIGLAMIQQSPERRRSEFEKALEKVRQGLQRTPQNAQLFLQLGQAQAGLGNYLAADSAFVQALQMHAAYADQIEGERRSMWAELFQRGSEQLQEGDEGEAIRTFELANRMHGGMPESSLYLGQLYTSAGDWDRAIAAWNAVVTAAEGPIFAELDAELQEYWSSYKRLAQINVAVAHSGPGVGAFQEQRFADAARAFRAAAEANPYGRDYWFNLSQALFARSAQLRDELEAGASPERTAEINRELATLYTDLEQATERLRGLDPLNDQVNPLFVEAFRGQAFLAGEGDRERWQQRTLEVLRRQEALQFLVDDVTVQPIGDDQYQVRGTLRNVALAAGAPARIRVSLVGIDGTVLGSQVITVSAPDGDQPVEFEATVEAQGEIAGYRYEPVS